MLPRLFVHLRNGDGEHRDHTGTDYISEDAAIHQIGQSAGAMLAEDLVKGTAPVGLWLTIERADGSEVATIEASGTLRRPAGSAG